MIKLKRGISTLLTEERRRKAITEIVDFYATERNEEIGVIAAGEILDFFLECLGADLFNKGVEEAFTFLTERLHTSETDLNALVKK